VHKLCEGADTTAPVECYEAAQDRTALLEAQSIELCICARSLQPVACAEQAVAETDLTDPEIVQICSARALDDVVGPGCTSA
jgi:hypothetical protein